MLKASIINMKSLSQYIEDPIIVGGGESNGRTLKVIFTQEAAAQLTPETNVYLSWRHITKGVKGYNVFTKIPDAPKPAWEITYPKEMLHEGDVLACIELVDDISVAASTNFHIHVLSDPWEGSEWIENDDLSEFKIALNRAASLTSELVSKVEELERRIDLNEFVDEDGDGVNDDPEIIEWTGGDEGDG